MIAETAEEHDEGIEVEAEEVQSGEQTETKTEEAADEVVVTIGDEAPPQEEEQAKAPNWVQELRRSHRELTRQKRELEERIKAIESPQKPEVTAGKKPKLEDHDYDSEAYEQALAEWYERKREADAVAAQREEEQKAADEAWKQQLSKYEQAKTELKVRDFEDAESVVQEQFSQVQQGIVVQGADNSALVIYALGKNPARAKELAAIKDPVKFAFAVAKLEKDLKVTNRRAPPAPETRVTGTAPKSGAVDSTLERLRAEAERTGDYSKVHEYKRKVRNKT